MVSHEATRTGAPMILLELARELKKELQIKIVFILCEGGVLVEKFKEIGLTMIFRDFRSGFIDAQANKIVTVLKDLPLSGILINSAESRKLNRYLYRLNVPTISLVHEMGSYYAKGAFKVIANYSDKVIFPAEMVAQQASENYLFPTSKTIIRGQGLLKPELLEVDRELAREQLRNELKLPNDAFIVLGCGTLSGRKGIDLFIFTALQVLREIPENLYFIWVGGEHPHLKSQTNWLRHDIRVKGLESKILFLGEKEDTTSYFVGSDVFYMTSRLDPFPCVIHEAMAAGVPILGFQNAGGFGEALEDGAGKLLPYGDIGMASDTIISWYQDDSETHLMIQKARERVLDKYNFKNYSMDIASILNEISMEKKGDYSQSSNSISLP